MSELVLKIIACIAMLLDHIAIIFDIAILPFRAIGRIAFPLYAFFIVEGYFKTSNVKKYKIRLLLIALASELPRKLFIRNLPPDEFVSVFVKDPIPTLLINNGLNAIFTLFIGLVLVDMLNWIDNKFGKSELKKLETYTVIFSVVSIITACVIAEIINCDYSYVGILMIVVFYYFRNNLGRLACGFAAVTVLDLSVSIFIEAELLLWCIVSICKIAALVPIFFYNGNSGYPSKTTAKKSLQWSFYVFYPVHLIILYILSIIVG